MNISQQLITVDSVTWTPITVPVDSISGATFNAKQIIISNSESGAFDIYRRLDGAVAGTQITIPAGSQEVWKASDDPRALTGYNASETGTTVGYLKSTSSSFNVAVLMIG